MSIELIKAALKAAKNSNSIIRDWEHLETGHGTQRFHIWVASRKSPLMVAVKSATVAEGEDGVCCSFTMVRKDLHDWKEKKEPTSPHEGARVSPGAAPARRRRRGRHNDRPPCRSGHVQGLDAPVQVAVEEVYLRQLQRCGWTRRQRWMAGHRAVVRQTTVPAHASVRRGGSAFVERREG